MRKPGSVNGLENLGRVRLSKNFFMRDFLYSEIANFYGIPNMPDNPDLAIAAGTRLCEELLEPLQATFGRISIRSAYRSPQVNELPNRSKLRGITSLRSTAWALFYRPQQAAGYVTQGSLDQLGNEKGHNCASNESNYARHIWDYRDADGYMGATACIVVNWYLDRYQETGDWQPLAWWVHDHLPYSSMEFFTNLCAFNLSWHEQPKRVISSYADPKGILTKPGMENHEDDHSRWYEGFPPAKNESQ
jgi:hypothetical protein